MRLLTTIALPSALIFAAPGATAGQAQPPPVPGPFHVLFEWNRTELSSDAMATLDNAAAAYQQVPGAVVEITGRSDRSGAASTNLRISHRRAVEASEYLQLRAVPPSAIRITALGENDPIVATADGVREARNRSVEIRFVPQ